MFSLYHRGAINVFSVMWFRYLMSPEVSRIESSVPRVVLLGGVSMNL